MTADRGAPGYFGVSPPDGLPEWRERPV